MSVHRAGRRNGYRLRLPEPNPPGLNHSILTGTLLDAPRPGRNPIGEPVMLVRIEFPVAHPEHPQTLLTCASCEVEVSAALAEQQLRRPKASGARRTVAPTKRC